MFWTNNQQKQTV